LIDAGHIRNMSSQISRKRRGTQRFSCVAVDFFLPLPPAYR
jgi:hypothetical protein